MYGSYNERHVDFHGLMGCQRTSQFWGVTALTPKTHFDGLSFMSYALRSSKASCRCVAWFGRSLDFTNISSMYTSMVLPNSGLNILVTGL